MSKTIIFGASGYIGKNLFAAYKKKQIEVYGTTFSKKMNNLLYFEVGCSSLADLNLSMGDIGTAIICSAITNIKYVNDNPDAAYKINVDGILKLIKELSYLDIHVIFLSSDNVFDGKVGGYRSGDIPAPVSQYGIQKYAVENELPHICEKYTILRLSKVVGVSRGDKTIFDDIATQLIEQSRLKAADDLIFNPTFIDDVVVGIQMLQEGRLFGTYNFCNPEIWDRYALSIEIADSLGYSRLKIDRIKFADFNNSVKRPLNTSMINSECFENFEFRTVKSCISEFAQNWISHLDRNTEGNKSINEEKQCPSCGCKNVAVTEVKVPLFRHYDWKRISLGGQICSCENCLLLFHDAPERYKAKGFESIEYSESGQTKHLISVDEYENGVTRSFLQSKIIEQNLKVTPETILDIGCFDGALLKELADIYPEAELYGYDVNPFVEKLFPKNGRFKFMSGELSEIDKTFSLIILSHSIMYIKNLRACFGKISSLLSPSGCVYIQTPDISKNYYYLLMADQYYFYTTDVMKNMLRCHSFNPTLVQSDWFPREIIAIATKSDECLKFVTGTQQHLPNIEFFEGVGIKLNELHGDHFGVLGTTINAAFINSFLGDRLDFFVDENYTDYRESFHGKVVMHPRNLSDNDMVIIPYGESGGEIKGRFEQRYKGNYLVV